MKVLNIFSNPIVKFFMSVVPTVWFTFFSVFGPQNDLFMNSSNKLTVLSIIINLIQERILTDRISRNFWFWQKRIKFIV